MQILKELHPVAAKEHTCMFCGCKINVGERYQRQTIADSGEVYDWVCHDDCIRLTNLLDMYGDYPEDGITADDFQCAVSDYLADNYRDKDTGKLREDIKALSFIEPIRKIINDIDK